MTTKTPKTPVKPTKKVTLTAEQKAAAIAEYFAGNATDLRLARSLAQDRLGLRDPRSVAAVYNMLGSVDDSSLIGPVLDAAKDEAVALGVPEAAAGIAEAMLSEGDLIAAGWDIKKLVDFAKRAGENLASIGDLVEIVVNDGDAANRLEHSLELAAELFPGYSGAAVLVYEAIYQMPE